MARILVQRGSSSNATRSTSSSSGSSSSASTSSSSGSGTEPQPQVPPVTICEETTDEKQDEVTVVEEEAECSDAKDVSLPSDEPLDRGNDESLVVSENNVVVVVEGEGIDCDSPVSGGDDPDSPPLPLPPPRPSSNVNRRSILGSFGDLQIGATGEGLGLGLLYPPLGVRQLDHILLLQDHSVRTKATTVLMSICHLLCPLMQAPAPLVRNENISLKPTLDNRKALKLGMLEDIIVIMMVKSAKCGCYTMANGQVASYLEKMWTRVDAVEKSRS
ncbi:hypothetical protein Bca52824_010086 [Brassica carinata]|uniref:Uncharacterized protein n=1 Tax=Brassica carinata TaxID=52824 RepID=A0A8X7WFC5_BRACI|nr:hypothetical protein Bca52824_010086 [Brassica carinata]